MKKTKFLLLNMILTACLTMLIIACSNPAGKISSKKKKKTSAVAGNNTYKYDITTEKGLIATINDRQEYNRIVSEAVQSPAGTNAMNKSVMAAADGLLGDVDSNGQITIIDALLVARYVTGDIPANFNSSAADVDGNGAIDINDAMLIGQYVAGLITEFPVNNPGLNFEYTNSGAAVTITKYIGTDTVVNIPSSIDNTPVVKIGNNAFTACTGLTSITIPSSVTSIGTYAFSSCTGLTSITIPSGVTSIENSVFYGCSGLTNITIPSGVSSIGDSAFAGCNGLTNITIPSTVMYIGNYAFSKCNGLANMIIPSDIKFIGDFTFSNCSNLTSITILSSSVTSIGDGAFYNCTGLSSITIPSSVTSIGSIAFYNCISLKNIEIPSSVTSIGYKTFNGCTNLLDVIIRAVSPPTATSGYTFEGEYGTGMMFDTTNPLLKIYVPSASVDAYKTAEYWSEYADLMVGY